MARPTTAARRYAEAAFAVSSRDRTQEAWGRDLATVAETIADDRVRDILDNPSVPLPERIRLVQDLFGTHVSAPVLNLVRLLVDRGRTELLPAVADEYRRLINRQRGIVEAVVTSAAPLTTVETQAVRARVESMAGAAVDLRTEVDASLIGGLTVMVGGRLLDASVRGRLERLRDQLVAGTRTG